MLTRAMRRLVAGKKEPYLFQSYDSNIDFASVPEGIGLYIHIPFCKALCPFCPYNKIIYDYDKAQAYKEALFKEIALLKNYLAGKAVSSIYIGGGTPSLLLAEITELLRFLAAAGGIAAADVGMELHPREATGDHLARMKAAGINMVSLGVQTFSDEKLRLLGRNYSGCEARAALERLMAAGFDCVDVDIMFNLPNQTDGDIVKDIATCFSYGADQLSAYPLIIFPLTKMAKKMKREKLHRLNELKEYKILRQIEQTAAQYGYQKTSIWTYAKPGAKKYTSVTRQSFIGVGAGATSQFGNYFYVNTFNVDAYIAAANRGRLPINLVNEMTEKDRMVFWLFWRCYETSIDTAEFQQLFKAQLQEEFPLLFKAMRLFSLVKEEGKTLKLTSRGAYLYHLIEKHYSKTYLNDMWAAGMSSPWRDSFRL